MCAQLAKLDELRLIDTALSGVGEPDAVKKNWGIGLECTMPVALRTEADSQIGPALKEKIVEYLQ